MISVVDKRRLEKGAAALALPEPTTEQELEDTIGVLHDAIAALQSLDDLGSDQANQQAWDDQLLLYRKYARLVKQRTGSLLNTDSSAS